MIDLLPVIAGAGTGAVCLVAGYFIPRRKKKAEEHESGVVRYQQYKEAKRKK